MIMMTASCQLMEWNVRMLLGYLCTFYTLQTVLANNFVTDELLSARCQAKCLSDFEANAKTKGIARRQLKHTIIPLCKDDVNCSSCATPCREPFESLRGCADLHCKDAKSRSDCYKSCQFLKDIYTHKPGDCPKPSWNVETSECVSSCSRDGDCPHTQKCCINGCGKSCTAASSLLTPLLLPIPVSVEVKERKRGRSAIVSWLMDEESRLQSYANLYVVQWKWGVSENEEEMTNWQTISIRNKLYSILKHLLSPGRYYVFRVAAVNVNGSRGFSEQSPSFKLSKSPKAPRAPRNLETGASFIGVNGAMDLELQWLPPTSDLPIVHYEVSWSESPERRSAALSTDSVQSDMPLRKQREKKDRDTGFEPENSGFESELMTELIGADRTETVIRGLKWDVRYLIEVHAIVKTDRRELHGEKAAVFVRRSQKGATTRADWLSAIPSTTQAPSSINRPNVGSLAVEKPYFQNGLLKAKLTWDAESNVDEVGEPYEYDIAWWPVVCMGAAYPAFSLTKPLIATSRAAEFELYDLQFGCHYITNVTAVVTTLQGRERRGPAARKSFETPSCQDTPVVGEISPNCPTLPPQVPSPPQDLFCSSRVEPIVQRARFSAGRNVTAHCTWSQPLRSDKPITGYRVISGQKLTHNMGMANVDPFPSIDRNTVSIRVFSQDKQELNLHSLLSETEYIVQIQAISEIGVGPSIHRTFNTPSLKVKPSFVSDSNPAPSEQPTADSPGDSSAMSYDPGPNRKLIKDLRAARARDGGAVRATAPRSDGTSRDKPAAHSAATATYSSSHSCLYKFLLLASCTLTLLRVTR